MLGLQPVISCRHEARLLNKLSDRASSLAKPWLTNWWLLTPAARRTKLARRKSLCQQASTTSTTSVYFVRMHTWMSLSGTRLTQHVLILHWERAALRLLYNEQQPNAQHEPRCQWLKDADTVIKPILMMWFWWRVSDPAVLFISFHFAVVGSSLDHAVKQV